MATPAADTNGDGRYPPAQDDFLSSGALIGIIVAIILVITGSVILAFYALRRIRNRRKNHGEYRPQQEENIHAKNLPYISPPNIQGLI